ncbi:MAG: PKD domain-containing protein, partial [Candidatus Bathyarchaeaceae archaeon]
MQKKMGLVVALILSLVLTAFPTMMPMTYASSIKLYPIADSWVENKYPTVNHGGDSILYCRSDTSKLWGNITKRSYLKFDLTGIDPNAIHSVTLYLYCTEATIPPDFMDVDAHQTGDDWIEGTAVGDINWNNAPPVGAYITTTAVDGTGKWYGWGGDAMTNYVKTEAAGDGIVSFVLKLPNDTEYIHPPLWRRCFSSKEGANSPCLKIFTRPVACFAVSNYSPNTCETVIFNASCSYDPDGVIVKYEWDWEGDGTYDFDAGTNPIATHHYSMYGLYYPKLKVTDNDGLTNETYTTILVRGYPVAHFTWTPPNPTVYQTVNFDASASTPNGGYIVNYTWNFGDSSPSVTGVDPIINHIYTTFGTYTVTLTIIDSEDLTDTYTDTIRILIRPVANFTHLPIEPTVNQPVTFDASASYSPDPDRSIVSYTWNFGDGNTTVNGAVITHAYKAEGTYNVTLTVTDDDGLTNTAWRLITVGFIHDVAVIDVAPSLTEFHVGETVTITVVAKNKGLATETFNITVYYNENILGTKNVIDLAPDTEITLAFSWNTLGVSVGEYVIKAVASKVPGETYIDDNIYIDDTVKVKPIRDVAIIDVTPSITEVNIGQVVNITVTVRNEGTLT